MNTRLNIAAIQPRRRHSFSFPLETESQGSGNFPALHLSTWATSTALFDLANLRQNAAIGMLSVVGASRIVGNSPLDAANIAIPAMYLISDAKAAYDAAMEEQFREMAYFGLNGLKRLVEAHGSPEAAADALGVSIDHFEEWGAEGIQNGNITQSEAIRMMTALDAIHFVCCDLVEEVAQGKAKGASK